MSYQVLARKWRPQNFKEMVGQEHVLRALINALDGDRLHHAYLFTGTRGVGKTTIARILAKCLNCEKGVSSTPCGECNSCIEITAGNFVDLIEVDAASRTKVEDTRELLDNVQYAPTRARFKVYLIDEVHMLTGHSFNALLKTLEEPPPHVKFLFATTDPQKLPATILSRCLQFNLKRMPVDMISGHLQYLLKEESIPFEEPSLRLIARAADGSMRDALSLLDQSIAFGGNELKETDVRDMLGTVSHEPLIALLKSVSAGEGSQLLQQVEELSGVSPDFAASCDALISLLHQLAVLQVVPESIQDVDSIQELAKQLTKEEVQLFYQIALQGRGDLALAPDPRAGFEMILLRMLSFRPLRQGMQLASSADSIDKSTSEASKKKTLKVDAQKEVNNKVAKEVSQETKPVISEEPPPWEVIPASLETAIVEKPRTENKTKRKIEELPENKDQQKQKPTATSAPVKKQASKQAWHEIVPQLQLGGRAAELIKHCLLVKQENGIISLRLEKSSEGLLADSIKLEIQSALAEYNGNSVSLNITVADAETEETQLQSNETPAQRSGRKAAEKQQQAEQNIISDPFVVELSNRFGAQIVPGSVHPK